MSCDKVGREAWLELHQLALVDDVIDARHEQMLVGNGDTTLGIVVVDSRPLGVVLGCALHSEREALLRLRVIAPVVKFDDLGLLEVVGRLSDRAEDNWALTTVPLDRGSLEFNNGHVTEECVKIFDFIPDRLDVPEN